jgi:hypothetical protein
VILGWLRPGYLGSREKRGTRTCRLGESGAALALIDFERLVECLRGVGVASVELQDLGEVLERAAVSQETERTP